jgi:H+/Cl- antiporter ClcA
MGDLLQPWHLIVVLFVLGVLLIPAIFYLLTLQNALSKCAPTSRTMEPGMVWLLLIPLLNLIWNFIVVTSMARSLANEYARRGIPSSEPLPGQSIGIAMSVCNCCCIIPVLGAFAGLAGLVLWIVYWIKIAEFSRTLDISQPVAPIAPTP